MLTQGQVEDEITRLSARLEEFTDLYAKIVVECAHAEVEYQKKKQTLLIQEANRGAVAERRILAKEIDAAVYMRCESEAAKFRILEARVEAGKQSLYSLRAQLNALQTISANLRSQT